MSVNRAEVTPSLESHELETATTTQW